MPKTPSDAKADPAEEFITLRRRSYPTLYPSDNSFLLDLLARNADDYFWDETGNVKAACGERLRESFTEEGWKYMCNNSASEVPVCWQEPRAESLICNIPENISRSWASKISSLCFFVKNLEAADVKEWIRLHQRFGGGAEAMQRDQADSSYQSFLKVKVRLELVWQRLIDIAQKDAEKERHKTKPWNVAPGVLVHHKDYASAETATVTVVGSIPHPTDASSRIAVAVLDKPLVNGTTRIVPSASLVPLSFPPTTTTTE